MLFFAFLFITTHHGKVIAACKIAPFTRLCLFSKGGVRHTLGKTRKKSLRLVKHICCTSYAILCSFLFITTHHGKLLGACRIAPFTQLCLFSKGTKHPGKERGKTLAGRPYLSKPAMLFFAFLFITTHQGNVITACKIATFTQLCLFSKGGVRHTLRKTRKKCLAGQAYLLYQLCYSLLFFSSQLIVEM